ncbi:hypothetical protein J6590_008364 [Homalodisca vitripennis]|nr:hypothetical protein J6590_008364 [Homalodisca vitripennis]
MQECNSIVRLRHPTQPVLTQTDIPPGSWASSPGLDTVPSSHLTSKILSSLKVWQVRFLPGILGLFSGVRHRFLQSSNI